MKKYTNFFRAFRKRWWVIQLCLSRLGLLRRQWTQPSKIDKISARKNGGVLPTRKEHHADQDSSGAFPHSTTAA